MYTILHKNNLYRALITWPLTRLYGLTVSIALVLVLVGWLWVYRPAQAAYKQMQQELVDYTQRARVCTTQACTELNTNLAALESKLQVKKRGLSDLLSCAQAQKLRVLESSVQPKDQGWRLVVQGDYTALLNFFSCAGACATCLIESIDAQLVRCTVVYGKQKGL